MKYQIISDSSCDLSADTAADNCIEVVPFYVSFDSKNYFKEGKELEVRDFYQKMVDNPKVFPKSSLPSVSDYIDAFTPFVLTETAIICICITTKFSGSYNSACTARDMLLEDYPGAKISIIDSTVNTVLQGLFVLEAARMQREGLSYEDTVKNLERIKSSGRIFFTIGGIDYLRAGGRIGKLKGIAADVLGIKPLITLKQGEIFPSGLIRSRLKGRVKLINQVIDYISKLGVLVKDCCVTIGYGYAIEEAKSFRNELLTSLKEQFGFEPPIGIQQIGAAIGVHTGPHPLGIGIVLRYDAPEYAFSAATSLSFS